MGAQARRAGFGACHVPSDPPAQVDLQAKTMGAAERDEEARSAWRERVRILAPRELVFVDEGGAQVGLLVPLRARAPRGERACGQAPRNRGKNTAPLASMTSSGMGTCVAVDGATTKVVFEAYVEQVPAPALRPGQVVVLDNLGAHKGERVRDLVEDRGCELLFPPSYSPDFSPIEEAFSKGKALLRRAQAHTREALVEAMGRALDAVTPEDATAWSVHCGYGFAHFLARYKEFVSLAADHVTVFVPFLPALTDLLG